MQAFICERHSSIIASMSQCLGTSSGQYFLPATVLMHGTFNRGVRALLNLYRNRGECVRGEGVYIHLRAQLFMAASEASRISVVRILHVSGVQGSPRTARTTSPSASEAYGSERPMANNVSHSAGEAEHKDNEVVVQTKCAGEAEERRGRKQSFSDDVYSSSAKKRREHSEHLSREHLKCSRRRSTESFCSDDFVLHDSRRPTKSSSQNVSGGLSYRDNVRLCI